MRDQRKAKRFHRELFERVHTHAVIDADQVLIDFLKYELLIALELFLSFSPHFKKKKFFLSSILKASRPPPVLSCTVCDAMHACMHALDGLTRHALSMN